MKRLVAYICIGALAIGTLCACGNKEEEKQQPEATKTEKKEVNYWTDSEEDLEVLACEGDVKAQYSLGAYYDYGLNDVEQNFSKAYEWYEMAAKQNYGPAELAIGYMYMNGCGVEKSFDDAYGWFEKALQDDCTRGYTGLGRLYLEGYGEEDTRAEQAASYFSKSYGQNNLDGTFYMAYIYEKGIGIEQNADKAVSLYTTVIHSEPADVTEEYAINGANTQLGVMYMEGEVVDKDYEAGISYIKTAAEAGYAMAQYYMGLAYENGYGVDQSYEDALEWMLKAADVEYAPALNQIGYMYYNGYGVDVDYEQAVYYQKLSAMQGYAPAQINLGYLYENGYGVEKIYQTSLDYYQMAAKQNYEGAQEAVARVTELIDEK